MNHLVEVTLKGRAAGMVDFDIGAIEPVDLPQMEELLFQVPSTWLNSEDLFTKLAQVASSIMDWYAANLRREGSAAGYFVVDEMEYQIPDENKVDDVKWGRYYVVNEDGSWEQHLTEPSS